MMTTSSLWAFLSKPQIIVQAFTGMFGRARSRGAADPLADIELPMRVFVIGIPIVGAAVIAAAHFFFGVHIALGVLAIPLVFVFTLIAVTSTGLTSITPVRRDRQDDAADVQRGRARQHRDQHHDRGDHQPT